MIQNSMIFVGGCDMKLFWYNIKGMDAAAYDAALSLMDAERQSRVKDFPNEDDRKRSAAGE